MKTVSLAFSSVLFFATATAAVAQKPATSNAFQGDAALTYHWVRTNTQPGDCGCFYLNGGGISGSWNFRSQWSAVAELSAEHASDAPTTGASLTLTSYMGGARYQLPHPGGSHTIEPFVQVLVGGANAGGGAAGAGDGTHVFTSRIGGAIDLPLSQRFAARLIQADYDLTTFANGTNDRQNNLLLAAGLVFHWSHRK
jgi:outer membrane immunogenic protein